MDGAAPGDLYERDFYAWTQDQAARLRALGPRNDGLDVAHVAEEIESLGRSQRMAVRSLLARTMEHLLKLRFHPDQQPRNHWRREVNAFRRQILRELEDSPSLRAARHALAAEEWDGAVASFLEGLALDGQDQASIRAALGDPRQPCFDLDRELLDTDWFPPPPPG